jgi:hypothetical protein
VGIATGVMEKACCSVTVATTELTRIELESNSNLCVDRTLTNLLTDGKILRYDLNYFIYKHLVRTAQ